MSSAKKAVTKKPVAKKAVAKKAVAKKTVAKKTVAKKVVAKKVVAKKVVAKKVVAKKTVAKKTVAKKPLARADLGAPVDGFFAKQPDSQRAIFDALRALVAKAAPDATASLKWGQPFYSVGPGMAQMVCGFGAHKSHVNVILPGSPEAFSDPDGLLEGEGKTGRRLVLRSEADIPTKVLLGWLRVAAERARTGS